MKEHELKIEVVENGFIVYDTIEKDTMTRKKYVFETPVALSQFVVDWGREHE